VKLKATIIVASLLAATAAHADTIYLKCWAQGLAYLPGLRQAWHFVRWNP
jgi:hypothetical protein